MSYLLADASSRAVITDVDSARQAAADAGIAVVDLDDDFSGWLNSQDPTPVEAGRKGLPHPLHLWHHRRAERRGAHFGYRIHF